MALETGNYIASLVATNPPGTDPKSQGDDHLRLTKNALLNCFAGFTGSIFVTGTDGGAANAYTLTPATALLAYSTRMVVAFAPTVQNTGASTLNISALGVKDIKSVSGAALVSGDLEVGTIYTAYYNGTEFRLLSITKNYADQLSFTGVLPSQAGNADKFITTNGTVASWSSLIRTNTMQFADSSDTTKRLQLDLSTITTGTTRSITILNRSGYFGDHPRSARTTNTILGVQDFGSEIVITGAGAFTQTLTAAATLGVWYCRYWNYSTGNITFDPNSTEQIDGANTGILEPGMGIDIFCDGTAFNCQRVGTPVTKVLTSGTSGTWPLGVRRVNWRQTGGGGSGAKAAAGTSAGPGAAAGYLEKSLTVTPNSAYTFAIGAGGVSQTTAGTAGNAGGNTTLTYNAVTYTTNGGAGGVTGTGTYAAGGTATNGDINITGGRAQNTMTVGFSIVGGNPLGTPQQQGNTITPETAIGFGSGGDGATSAQNSSAGAPGVIILSY